MTEITRGERMQIMLTPAEVAALDDWRFAKRMPSRASAIRELLKRGLAADGFESALLGEKSKDFGVVEQRPMSRGKRAKGNGAPSRE